AGRRAVLRALELTRATWWVRRHFVAGLVGIALRHHAVAERLVGLAEIVRQRTETTGEIAVNPPQRAPALPVKRRHPQARQHCQQDEAIPELQPPLDGVEDHSMQYPCPRRVVMNSAPSFLRTLETWTSSRFESVASSSSNRCS